jgi:ectoine hydroxylase-related dioxygenase (phytanoyl-CoA dioxygenase family)
MEITNNINLNCKDWLNHVQNILKSDGFCLVDNVIDIQSCEFGIKALKSSYKKIENLIGKDRLNFAGEVGVVRAPMAFDSYFFTLLENKIIQIISEYLVDHTSILHLQNGFIFPKYKPDKDVSNFQNTFHTDYPRYHNGYIASINILITFVDINESDEIFYVVKNTHQSKQKPSQEYCSKNKISISAKAGSILIFDSTLFHCAGRNMTDGNWYGVNHQFTRSFMKQQLDYVRVLGHKICLEQTDRVQQMLGYYTRVPTCLDDYYKEPKKRLYRGNQG